MMAQSAFDMGKIIAAARSHRRLTQAQLARAVGASQNWISEVEAGKSTARLGKVLGVLSYLGVRLQVSEAPWLAAQVRAKPSGARRDAAISLHDIIAAHSTSGARPGKKSAR